MTKVPVRETIGVAYRFTLDNFTAIVGLIWLPMLLVIGLDYLQGQILSNDEVQGANLIRIGAYTLGALLLYAIMYVAVTEQALGLRQGRRFVHIALGPAEFRAFGAMLVLTLLLIFLFVIAFLAAGALAFVAKAVGGALIGKAVEGWLMLLGVGFVVFCAVRLGFLLIPAVVAERRVSLERSWLLTQGSFWRIVAVYAVLVFPLFLIGFIVVMMFMADEFAALQSQLASGMTQKAFAEAFDKILAAHRLHIMAVTFFLSPFLVGFSLGAAAYAYGILARRTETPAPDAVP